MPRQVNTTTEGHPEIPAIRQLIAIPECEEVSIILQTNSPLILENYMVYPAPTYQQVQNPDGTVYMEEVFTRNNAVYNLNTFGPEVVAEITHKDFIRGQRIAEVIIYPIQFNPVTAQLQVFTDIDITVAFTGATGAVSVNNGIFSNLTQNVTLNYTEGGIGASINDRSDRTGSVEWIEVTSTSGVIEADYLIVSAPKFWDEQNEDLYALAQHRANYNGFDVAIVNVAHVVSDEVGYPYDPDNPLYYKEQRIRNFLKSVFDSGTAQNTYDGKLGYVLLVGGEGEAVPEEYLLPAWKEYHFRYETEVPADYHYICLTSFSDGTYSHYGDLFLGRLSVDSEAKLHNIVSKTIYFETEYQFASWKQNAMLNSGYEAANSIIDSIESIIPDNFTTLNYKRSEMEFAEICQALVDGFNDGQLVTQYSGHGGVNTWQTFNPTYFNQLSNFNKQGFVFSMACNTGWLDHSSGDCMAELFTTSSVGSVMFLGATRVTYRDHNFTFAISLHKAIWENLSHISGEFTLEGQIRTYLTTWNPNTFVNFYIHFGDPALNLMAQGYQITNDVTPNIRRITISSDITITQGATLNIGVTDLSHLPHFLHLQGLGRLIVDNESGIRIGVNVTLTKQKPENDITVKNSSNITINGICYSDVNMNLESGGTITVEQNGKLVLQSGSTVIISSGSSLIVKDGGTLVIEDCAVLKQVADGSIVIEDGGILCIHPNAILDVEGHSAFEILGDISIGEGCVHPYNIVPPTYIISSSGNIWEDKDYRMVRNLEIGAGASLKLNEVSLKFLNDKMIIIEPGGLIEVDGGTLTSTNIQCIAFDGWDGIYIKGNPDLPQTFDNQGAAILKNGAIIENANIAVQVGSMIVFPGTQGNGGGIFIAEDVIFRNNLRGVYFATYPYPPPLISEAHHPTKNLSDFNNCTFITNDYTLFDNHEYKIRMNGVSAIEFNNCTFQDERSDLTYDTSQKGIYSNNSSFFVNYCNFQNLKYGIYAVNSTAIQRRINVRFSDFSTYRGVYVLNIDNARILNNNFNIKPGIILQGETCSHYNYGLYIDNSTNYTLISNNFSTGVASNNPVCNVGIVARNTGALYNSIYANKFFDLTMGIQAIGINRGRKKEDGLELRCNILNNVEYDFFIKKETESSRFDEIEIEIEIDLHGIRAIQGNPQHNHTLAGNLFSGRQSYFLNNTNNKIDYHHHSIPLSSEPRLTPAYFSNNISFFPANYEYNHHSCPTRVITPISIIISDMENSRIEYETRNAELRELIDAGESEELERRIDEAGPGVDRPLYLFLMEIAPFLSDDVLAKIADKERGFTNVMIRNVLVKSPQAPKLAKVVEKLDNRGIPIPPPMRRQIDEGLDYLGEKELLELEVAYYKTEYDNAINEVISNITHEEEGWEDAPELREFLSGIDDIRYQYLLAEMYFAEGDYEQGMQLLNAIEADYEITEEAEIEKLNEYVSFYTLLAQYDDAEQYPWFTNLPEEALQELETYIYSSNRIGGKAIAILIMNEAIEYEEPIYYPDEIIDPKSAEAGHHSPFDIIEEESEKHRADGLNFKIYPNPGKDHITMQWCAQPVKAGQDVLETEPIRRYIQIYNSYGFMVHSFEITEDCSSRIIQLSTWQTGNYTAVLNWGNTQRVSMPFVVVR